MELFIGKAKNEIRLESSMANRHGLIAGATGTGKTVTMQVLAESFSDIGVPVVLADIKGDVSGMAKSGAASVKFTERCQKYNFALPQFVGYPVRFWDVFGKEGHPVRTTISDMGPLLLARLLNLSDVQSAVLALVFMIADDEGLLVLDMKDMRALLTHVQNNAKEYSAKYGQISSQSIASIQRSFLVLEQQGTGKLFGEPMLDILDFMQTDADGRGVVNILASDELYQNPQLYSMFLLWLLAELFENFPEAGDLDKPKLVFFFDEAHLLFSDAPQVLVQKIEQVVRLIRSKGIGIYFITQSPTDIPESVLGQLGNRIQHALRAYTPKDQKVVKAAAQTFRQNPSFKTEDAITELGVGEALVSVLDTNGVPGVVERIFIRPPRAQIGPIGIDERALAIKTSPFYGKYEKALDRESAYELLEKQKAERELEGLIGKDGWVDNPAGASSGGVDAGTKERASTPRESAGRRSAGGSGTASSSNMGKRTRASEPESLGGTILEAAAQALVSSAARSLGRQAGRKLVRGVLGSLLGR